MKTIRTFSLLILLSQPTLLMAQNNSISYSYDTAGNRTERSITVSQVKERDATDIKETEDAAESRIHITADANAGTVRVEIIGYNDTDKCHITLYNASGISLTDITATESITTIDLNDKPAGVYILHTVLNGKKDTWKIAYR